MTFTFDLLTLLYFISHFHKTKNFWPSISFTPCKGLMIMTLQWYDRVMLASMFVELQLQMVIKMLIQDMIHDKVHCGRWLNLQHIFVFCIECFVLLLLIWCMHCYCV